MPKRLSDGLSVTQKVFVRLRNGTAAKVVREHYLRDDIPCLLLACAECATLVPADARHPAPPAVLSASATAYLVVDTNIVLHALDLLESPLVCDVVVPQTTLDEVRNRLPKAYERLRALTRSDKRFAVFHNEFCEAAHVARLPGESINDRNDRAIREVCVWYASHLARQGVAIPVVFLCNDRGSRMEAKKIGVDARLLEEYVEGLENREELRDLIPKAGDSVEDAAFPEHYSEARLKGGLANGTLFRGTFNVSRYTPSQGSVHPQAFPRPLSVTGDSRNRAFPGDSVVVELVNPKHWDAPDEDTEQVPDSTRLAWASAAKKAMEEGSGAPSARVVGVLRRLWRLYVGQIDPKSTEAGHSAKACVVVLMDKTLPNVRIHTRRAPELVGQRVVVAVDGWPLHLRLPEGHFVRALGAVELAEAETEALLLEHDVEYRPFNRHVLACLPEEGHDWKVPETIPQGREDLRDRLVCSIDPPNCVDIDDALHARPLPNGNTEVGVHIADVTHFVGLGLAVDVEGALRATSVYLVDKRIDMLPMLLGTDLCLLRPFVERYAFSVMWELDANADIVNVTFHKSVILLRQAFSYQQAQDKIDDASATDELTVSMRTLLGLSQKLRAKRMAAGALNLALPEVKVHVDLETLDPNEVEIKAALATNLLVEEFMLLANILVAQRIYEAFPQTAMLRRHQAPAATSFETLNRQLHVRKGLELLLGSLRALADSLDRAVDPKDSYFNTLVRIMATRCMTAAEYFLLGLRAVPEFRHYGLAADIYTHFTLPIRRYCDVVAHRQLGAAIGYEVLDPALRDKHRMEALTRNMNRRHRNAQFAGRASIEYFVGQVMKNNHLVQQGYVMGVFATGVAVLVPKFGVEGVIGKEVLGEVEYNDETFEVTLPSGRVVAVFDEVQVEVRSVVDEFGKRTAELTLA